MIKYLKYLIILLSTNTYSAGAHVANVFSNGDLVSSSKMNANFQELADRIDIYSTAGTWSVASGAMTADNASYNIMTVASDGTYVLKEIIHTATANTSCTVTAGSSVIQFPWDTYQISLSQGITLNPGDTITMSCYYSTNTNLQVNATLSGIKYNTP